MSVLTENVEDVPTASTPSLVRTFVHIKIVGSREPLDTHGYGLLSAVVDELRARGVLD